MAVDISAYDVDGVMKGNICEKGFNIDRREYTFHVAHSYKLQKIVG